MMLETIKDYLISIGFNVDKNSYAQFVSSLNNIDKTISSQATNINKYGVSITKFIGNYASLNKSNKDFASQIGLINQKLKESETAFEKVFGENQKQWFYGRRRFTQQEAVQMAQAKKKLDDLKLQSTKEMAELEKNMLKTAATITATIEAAAVAIAALVAAAGAALLSKLSSSDMDVQKLSRRMFMSQKNAYSMKMSMDAMGLKSMEDLQDVAMNPELRQRFLRLRRISSENAPSAEYEKYMRQIRDFQFQFTEMQLRMQIGFQKIGLYIMKYIVEPLSKTGFFQALAELGQELLPILKPVIDALGSILKSSIQISLIGIKALTMIIKMVTALVRLLKGDVKGALDDLDFSKMFDAKLGKNSSGNPVKDTWENIKKTAGNYYNGLKYGKGAAKNLEFTNDFINRFEKTVGNDAPITSIMDGKHAPNSGHYRGLKFDIGLKGKSLNDIARFYQGLNLTKGLDSVNFESPNKNDFKKYQELIEVLKNNSINTSKLHWLHNPAATGLHYDVKTNPNLNVTININGNGKHANEIAEAVATKIQSLDNRKYQPITA